jgi:hypothetical protein
MKILEFIRNIYKHQIDDGVYEINDAIDASGTGLGVILLASEFNQPINNKMIDIIIPKIKHICDVYVFHVGGILKNMKETLYKNTSL